MRLVSIFLLIITLIVALDVHAKEDDKNEQAGIQSSLRKLSEDYKQIQRLLENSLTEEKALHEAFARQTENPKRNWLSEAAPTFFSTLAGGLLTLVSAITVLTVQRRNSRQSLEGAFAGEIGALIGIVKHRNYREHIQSCIALMEQTNEPQILQIRVTYDYFTVYKQNASQLGLLRPPMARDVSIFYTYCFSILEDFQSMATVIPSFLPLSIVSVVLKTLMTCLTW